MKFSIIIPMYNVEKFVAKAIESCINQSYENIEIICVDDCGVDKSIDVAKEFATKDKRVKIVQNKENLGTFATRNNGAISANGEYLFFLDADDYLHSDTCLKCYEILQDSAKNTNGGGQIDFIMFNLFRQDEKDGEFKQINIIEKSQIIDDGAFEAMYFGADNHYFNLAVKCINKDIYLKALDFANIKRRLSIAEDILASTAILGVSKKIALLDSALYYYCYNADSATRIIEPSKIKERIENLRFVASKFEEFANKGDERYGVFVLCLSKILYYTVMRRKIQPFIDEYEKRLKKGYPKWLARFILSLQRRKFGARKQEHDLRNFIQANKSVFDKN